LNRVSTENFLLNYHLSLKKWALGEGKIIWYSKRGGGKTEKETKKQYLLRKGGKKRK